MQYHELHQRYGMRIAKRIQEELEPSEFGNVRLDTLSDYLENRAFAAQRQYQLRLDDPFIKDEANARETINLLHNRWREAEEVSYLVIVAEEMNSNVIMRRATG